MGKLKNHYCYLSGAIDRCPNLGIDWRRWLSEELINRYGVIPYNPMDKPVDIPGEHEFREERRQWKETGRHKELKEFVKIIRHVDLRMCDRSDFGIFYIDIDIHACGTYEELSWMNRSKKPCLVVCKQGRLHIPDWLYATLPLDHLMDTWDDLFVYLDKVNSGKVSDLGRWLFFKY